MTHDCPECYTKGRMSKRQRSSPEISPDDLLDRSPDSEEVTGVRKSVATIDTESPEFQRQFEAAHPVEIAKAKAAIRRDYGESATEEKSDFVETAVRQAREKRAKTAAELEGAGNRLAQIPKKPVKERSGWAEMKKNESLERAVEEEEARRQLAAESGEAADERLRKNVYAHAKERLTPKPVSEEERHRAMYTPEAIEARIRRNERLPELENAPMPTVGEIHGERLAFAESAKQRAEELGARASRLEPPYDEAWPIILELRDYEIRLQEELAEAREEQEAGVLAGTKLEPRERNEGLFELSVALNAVERNLKKIETMTAARGTAMENIEEAPIRELAFDRNSRDIANLIAVRAGLAKILKDDTRREAILGDLRARLSATEAELVRLTSLPETKAELPDNVALAEMAKYLLADTRSLIDVLEHQEVADEDLIVEDEEVELGDEDFITDETPPPPQRQKRRLELLRQKPKLELPLQKPKLELPLQEEEGDEDDDTIVTGMLQNASAELPDEITGTIRPLARLRPDQEAAAQAYTAKQKHREAAISKEETSMAEAERAAREFHQTLEARAKEKRRTAAPDVTYGNTADVEPWEREALVAAHAEERRNAPGELEVSHTTPEPWEREALERAHAEEGGDTIRAKVKRAHRLISGVEMGLMSEMTYLNRERFDDALLSLSKIYADLVERNAELLAKNAPLTVAELLEKKLIGETTIEIQDTRRKIHKAFEHIPLPNAKDEGRDQYAQDLEEVKLKRIENIIENLSALLVKRGKKDPRYYLTWGSGGFMHGMSRLAKRFKKDKMPDEDVMALRNKLRDIESTYLKKLYGEGPQSTGALMAARESSPILRMRPDADVFDIWTVARAELAKAGIDDEEQPAERPKKPTAATRREPLLTRAMDAATKPLGGGMEIGDITGKRAQAKKPNLIESGGPRKTRPAKQTTGAPWLTRALDRLTSPLEPKMKSEPAPRIDDHIDRLLNIANASGIKNARVIYEQLLRECRDRELSFEIPRYVESMAKLSKALEAEDAEAVHAAYRPVASLASRFGAQHIRIREAEELIHRAKPFMKNSDASSREKVA